MDPIMLCELLDTNRDWEVTILPDNRGVLLGDYDTLVSLLDSLNLGESYIYGN